VSMQVDPHTSDLSRCFEPHRNLQSHATWTADGERLELRPTSEQGQLDCW
jgi:hypothetical protein